MLLVRKLLVMPDLVAIDRPSEVAALLTQAPVNTVRYGVYYKHAKAWRWVALNGG